MFRPRMSVTQALGLTGTCLLALFGAGEAWGTSFFCGGTTDITVAPGITVPMTMQQATGQSINFCPISTGLVSGLGFMFDHRPYEPATPLGLLPGFDISIETTLVKIPASFTDGLSSLSSSGGGGSTSLGIPFMPSLKLHFAKGIGPVDIGISALMLPNLNNWLNSMYFIGGDVKWTFWQKEEGLTYAMRLGYMHGNLPIPLTVGTTTLLAGSPITMSIATNTITPMFLASKKLGGFDPYVGLGWQFVFGVTSVSLSQSGVTVSDAIPSTLMTGGLAVIGLSMRIPYLGLRFTPEMAYSTAGAVSAGLKFGFTF